LPTIQEALVKTIIGVVDGGDITTTLQDALDSLPARGGRIELMPGTYTITSSVVVPTETGDGRTIEIVGRGEVILYNKAAANNPTLKAVGVNGAGAHQRLYFRNLTFVGEAGYPNHGLHLRFVMESAVEDCLFCCHGNGIYCDGGLFAIAFRGVKIWPAAKKHSSPTTHTGSSGILFDTPFDDGASGESFAHTITIDDLTVNAGGRGVEVKAGYDADSWRFGRVLAEGLTGGNGWGLDLTGVNTSEIGPLYTEFNSSGVLGDANDLMLRLHECEHVTVLGGGGSGKIQLTSCKDVHFHNTFCQKFDADDSNVAIATWGVHHSSIGGAAAGYTNNSTGGKLEWRVRGTGAAQINRIDGKLARGTSVETGAGPNDDVHGVTAEDGGVVGASIRWVDAAGTGTAPRILYAQKSIANDGVFVTGRQPRGFIEIITDNDEIALYQARGVGAAPVELLDPQSKFTAVKDTASSYNVYIESGDLRIQNKTGSTRLVTLFLRTVQ
jgi:hypothetical protein